MNKPALLVLEDGRSFAGTSYGASGETFGEAVFTTGMTGYQETLTDPSYHRQIVTQTAPHIGNTGINDEDDESQKIWVAGYVVRDPARVPSNWRAKRSLDDQLKGQGIVGISGIDTRALTRHLRERGAMRAGISTEILAVNPDGIFMSNGPGDPETTEHPTELLKALLERNKPYFGICFGNQVFGRALGLGTFKLKYGHRGINQPVLDRATGKVEITAQNHGFAVDAPIGETVETPYGTAEVSHVSLNDNVVEGLRLTGRDGRVLAFSVQYHPEAAAGPHDSAYLFDRFVELMEGRS